MRIALLIKDICCAIYNSYTGAGEYKNLYYSNGEWTTMKFLILSVLSVTSMILFSFFYFGDPYSTSTCWIFFCTCIVVSILPIFEITMAFIFWWGHSIKARVFKIKYLVSIKDMPLYLNEDENYTGDENSEIIKIAKSLLKKGKP